MNKSAVLILFSILFQWCFAQERTEKIEEPFTKVKVSSGIIATIHVNAPENKVVIDGLDKEEVDVRFRKDELRISLPVSHLFSNSDTKVDIYVQEVTTIEATSSAVLTVKGTIQQAEFFLKAVELASIDIQLQVDKLHAHLLTGGIIYVKGKAQEQEVVIKTGAEYYAEHLITQITKVEVSYKGIAEVYAKESCIANVIAGGEVSVFGNPATFNDTTKLGGLIKKVLVTN